MTRTTKKIEVAVVAACTLMVSALHWHVSASASAAHVPAAAATGEAPRADTRCGDVQGVSARRLGRAASGVSLSSPDVDLTVHSQSGKFCLVPTGGDDSEGLCVYLDSMKEYDCDGNIVGGHGPAAGQHAVQSFANIDFDISDPDVVQLAGRHGDLAAMKVVLAVPVVDGRALLEVETLLFQEAGFIDIDDGDDNHDNDESVSVSRGTVKFTVRIIGWPFCSPAAPTAACSDSRTDPEGTHVELKFGIAPPGGRHAHKVRFDNNGEELIDFGGGAGVRMSYKMFIGDDILDVTTRAIGSVEAGEGSVAFDGSSITLIFPRATNGANELTYDPAIDIDADADGVWGDCEAHCLACESEDVCDECAMGYVVAANGTCGPVCPAGSFVPVLPQQTTDTNGTSAPTQLIAGNATTLRDECQAFSMCADGQWTAQHGTATSDVLCAACEPCIAGAYRAAPCVGAEYVECEPFPLVHIWVAGVVFAAAALLMLNYLPVLLRIILRWVALLVHRLRQRVSERIKMWCGSRTGDEESRSFMQTVISAPHRLANEQPGLLLLLVAIGTQATVTFSFAFTACGSDERLAEMSRAAAASGRSRGKCDTLAGHIAYFLFTIVMVSIILTLMNKVTANGEARADAGARGASARATFSASNRRRKLEKTSGDADSDSDDDEGGYDAVKAKLAAAAAGSGRIGAITSSASTRERRGVSQWDAPTGVTDAHLVLTQRVRTVVACLPLPLGVFCAWQIFMISSDTTAPRADEGAFAVAMLLFLAAVSVLTYPFAQDTAHAEAVRTQAAAAAAAVAATTGGAAGAGAAPAGTATLAPTARGASRASFDVAVARVAANKWLGLDPNTVHRGQNEWASLRLERLLTAAGWPGLVLCVVDIIVGQRYASLRDAAATTVPGALAIVVFAVMCTATINDRYLAPLCAKLLCARRISDNAADRHNKWNVKPVTVERVGRAAIGALLLVFAWMRVTSGAASERPDFFPHLTSACVAFNTAVGGFFVGYSLSSTRKRGNGDHESSRLTGQHALLAGVVIIVVVGAVFSNLAWVNQAPALSIGASAATIVITVACCVAKSPAAMATLTSLFAAAWVFFIWLVRFDDAGSMWGAAAAALALTVASTVVAANYEEMVAGRVRKGTLVQLLQSVRPTVFLGVPSAWRHIRDYLRESYLTDTARRATPLEDVGLDCCVAPLIDGTSVDGDLVSAFSRSGEQIADAIKHEKGGKLHKFWQDGLIRVYGQAEASGVVAVGNCGIASHAYGDSNDMVLISGIGATTTEERKLDMEDVGEHPEILLLGRNVMLGYLDRVEETMRAFAKAKLGTYLRTGDVGSATSSAGGVLVRVWDRACDVFPLGAATDKFVLPRMVESEICHGGVVELAAVASAMATVDGRLAKSPASGVAILVYVTLHTVTNARGEAHSNMLSQKALRWAQETLTKHGSAEFVKTADDVAHNAVLTHAIELGVRTAVNNALGSPQLPAKYRLSASEEANCRVKILSTGFTVEAGELTLSRRLRRHIAAKNRSEPDDATAASGAGGATSPGESMTANPLLHQIVVHSSEPVTDEKAWAELPASASIDPSIVPQQSHQVLASAGVSVFDRLVQARRAHGDKDAFSFKSAFDPAAEHSTVWTWAQVYDKVMAFALALYNTSSLVRDCGSPVIAVLGVSGPYWAVADIGCAVAGAVAAAIPPAVGQAELQALLARVRATVVVVDGRVQMAKLERTLRSGSCAHIKTIIMYNGDIVPGAIRRLAATRKDDGQAVELLLWRDFIAKGGGAATGDALSSQWWSARATKLKPAQAAAITFTDGATRDPGDQRAVLLSHDNITFAGESLSKLFCQSADVCSSKSKQDRLLSYLPMSQTLPRMLDLHASMHSGACVTFADGMALPTITAATRPRLDDDVAGHVRSTIRAEAIHLLQLSYLLFNEPPDSPISSSAFMVLLAINSLIGVGLLPLALDSRLGGGAFASITSCTARCVCRGRKRAHTAESRLEDRHIAYLTAFVDLITDVPVVALNVLSGTYASDPIAAALTVWSAVSVCRSLAHDVAHFRDGGRANEQLDLVTVEIWAILAAITAAFAVSTATLATQSMLRLHVGAGCVVVFVCCTFAIARARKFSQSVMRVAPSALLAAAALASPRSSEGSVPSDDGGGDALTEVASGGGSAAMHACEAADIESTAQQARRASRALRVAKRLGILPAKKLGIVKRDWKYEWALQSTFIVMTVLGFVHWIDDVTDPFHFWILVLLLVSAELLHAGRLPDRAADFYVAMKTDTALLKPARDDLVWDAELVAATLEVDDLRDRILCGLPMKAVELMDEHLNWLDRPGGTFKFRWAGKAKEWLGGTPSCVAPLQFLLGIGDVIRCIWWIVCFVLGHVLLGIATAFAHARYAANKLVLRPASSLLQHVRHALRKRMDQLTTEEWCAIAVSLADNAMLVTVAAFVAVEDLELPAASLVLISGCEIAARCLRFVSHMHLHARWYLRLWLAAQAVCAFVLMFVILFALKQARADPRHAAGEMSLAGLYVAVVLHIVYMSSGNLLAFVVWNDLNAPQLKAIRDVGGRWAVLWQASRNAAALLCSWTVNVLNFTITFGNQCHMCARKRGRAAPGADSASTDGAPQHNPIASAAAVVFVFEFGVVMATMDTDMFRSCLLMLQLSALCVAVWVFYDRFNADEERRMRLSFERVKFPGEGAAAGTARVLYRALRGSDAVFSKEAVDAMLTETARDDVASDGGTDHWHTQTITELSPFKSSPRDNPAPHDIAVVFQYGAPYDDVKCKASSSLADDVMLLSTGTDTSRGGDVSTSYVAKEGQLSGAKGAYLVLELRPKPGESMSARGLGSGMQGYKVSVANKGVEGTDVVIQCGSKNAHFRFAGGRARASGYGQPWIDGKQGDERMQRDAAAKTHRRVILHAEDVSTDSDAWTDRRRQRLVESFAGEKWQGRMLRAKMGSGKSGKDYSWVEAGVKAFHDPDDDDDGFTFVFKLPYQSAPHGIDVPSRRKAMAVVTTLLAVSAVWNLMQARYGPQSQRSLAAWLFWIDVVMLIASSLLVQLSVYAGLGHHLGNKFSVSARFLAANWLLEWVDIIDGSLVFLFELPNDEDIQSVWGIVIACVVGANILLYMMPLWVVDQDEFILARHLLFCDLLTDAPMGVALVLSGVAADNPGAMLVVALNVVAAMKR